MNLNSTAFPDTTAQAGEYLTFRLGAEQYAIGILKVQEIRSYEEPTRIANAPAHVKGVVNLRGVIVPIVDLRLKLDCPSANFDASTVVIVLNLGSTTVGVVVDAVADVLELGPDAIKPAPAMAHHGEKHFITGIGCVKTEAGERTLVLLNIEHLLSPADLAVADGSAAAAG